MTSFVWIRHAAIEQVEAKIAGRAPDGTLSAAGRIQAERLGRRLAEQNIRAIYSSPQLRARATAQELAKSLRVEISIAAELDELDYGDWTGRTLAELHTLPQWHAFNSVRSCTRIPNGELIIEVQARVLGLVERLRDRHRAESVGLVTHADVIRAALAYFLGIPVDLSLRLEVSPASVSIVALNEYGPSVRCLNNTEAWREN
jgi:broad specificity phosphatase PhoE